MRASLIRIMLLGIAATVLVVEIRSLREEGQSIAEFGLFDIRELTQRWLPPEHNGEMAVDDRVSHDHVTNDRKAADPLESLVQHKNSWRHGPDPFQDWFDQLNGSGSIDFEKNNPGMRQLFRELNQSTGSSIVTIRCNDKVRSLGTVVHASGKIVTKASELEDPIECMLSDGRRLAAKILGSNSDHDLALLEVEADDLIPVVWSKNVSPDVGSWLSTPNASGATLAVGVVSVERRKIESESGVLGILVEDSGAGARVAQVVPHSGAAKAGLQLYDVVTHIDDRHIGTRDELVRTIRTYQPGDLVHLSVMRAEERIKIDATLGTWSLLGAPPTDADLENRMQGQISARRSGFPVVLQHDTVLRPRDCGGPICDLDGRVAGINVARANRIASYAIPADVVQEVIHNIVNNRKAQESTASR